MKLHYELTGTGWSETTVTIGEREIKVTASYLSDALSDMIDATTSLLRGAKEVRFSFAEEPGEFRWVLERSGAELRLRILDFVRLQGGQSDGEGTVLVDIVVPVLGFGRKVLQMVEDLRFKIGEAEYQERWVRFPFPTDGLRRLRDAFKRLNDTASGSEALG